ncbi:guanine nucleotide-binding protein subunit alpha TDEL_0B07370 [Torulaspora delbrueckii]|uniref:Guanine nucleotide-binding protein alpha-1 subunit n=1 Tax=Torulaspora delbrueckii TaxID=4950 RepID=G8ZQH2_TORDE|nr:hypothetical protein TDEL_0B07370 [Torulaspora delbrueckii]CCE90866.1 hypothetical protein TDEL_0B07370 [Torulaspora delbrueckii]
MGCSISTHAVEDENDPFLQGQRANDRIEQSLQQEKDKSKSEIKLLLLGAGESGKSTVLKQLKLMHQGGFTHQERLRYTQVIWADAIQSMKILVIQARKLGIQLDCDNPVKSPELFECKRVLLKAKALDFIDAGVAGGSEFLSDYVLKYSERYETKRRIQSTGEAQAFDTEQAAQLEAPLDLREISNNLEQGTSDDQMFIREQQRQLQQRARTNEEVAYAIRALWRRDHGIKQCYARSNEFQLEGSAGYYFDHLDNFARPDYVCTDEDILKGRIKTTGITESEFTIGSSKFRVFDAGGQRSERKKWIHCFEGITAVLFVLAMSEYDQMLFEDELVNRMHESIMLFDTLVNSRWFRDTPFILFLNKMDLFEDKVRRIPIRKYFPDYQGRVGDVEAGISYFENIFLSLNRTDKPIYVRRTCATDSQTMKFVLSAVTDLITQQNLKRSGIL